MQRARAGIVAVAIAAAVAVVSAQKPDFSGTWTLDPDASGMGGGMGGGRGMMAGPMTVKQTADTLTVERQGRGGTLTMVYKLDGSESVNTMRGRGGQTIEQRSTAKWDGNALVVTAEMGGNQVTQRWTLDNGTLTIESTGGRGAGKRVYKKSS